MYVDEDGNEVTDYELSQRYDDMLDEVWGVVTICGMEYSTSSVLKDCDPIAYRVFFSEYLDWETGETIFEKD